MKIRDRFTKRLTNCGRLSQLAPGNLDAKVKLGNYFLVLTPPQTDETQKLLNEIFAADPNFIEGHILKASLLSVQNKPENEITDVLNHAIELDPKRIESYLSLARFFMKLQKGGEAEKVDPEGDFRQRQIGARLSGIRQIFQFLGSSGGSRSAV